MSFSNDSKVSLCFSRELRSVASGVIERGFRVRVRNNRACLARDVILLLFTTFQTAMRDHFFRCIACTHIYFSNALPGKSLETKSK